MNSTLCSAELTALLDSCRNAKTETKSLSRLFNHFNSTIVGHARRISSEWQEDLAQEGCIALADVAKRYTFSTTDDPKRFFAYAVRVIRTKMVDFFRSHIQKTPNFLPLINEDENDDDVYAVEICDNWDYVSTISMRIDLAYHFSAPQMKIRGFDDREIDVFNLYFYQGHPITDIAAELSISVSTTSRAIAKIRENSKDILKHI